ncbi:MAG TPA: glycine oxidase ThiO [Candidatus Cybelea sp.]|nr:glycine oxidase ThiO [Candidatus Cybelea sp.]
MDNRGGDVVVIGAGLIGLAIAFELAERGATVRVYDRGEPGRAASWAGAGMLAPYSEHINDGPLLEFCASSLREYPAFVERVRAASGADPRLRLDGVVHTAFNDIDIERLQRHAQTLAARHVAAEMLDRSSILSAEPWLGSQVAGGMIVSGEGCVDNRRLGRALVGACQTRGVLVGRSSALRVECDARRVLGVHTDLGFVAAGAIVNACGAWASQLNGVPASCVPPIEPIKGQMLALSAPAGLVRHATWVPGAYLVPRDDGRLLVGATVERAGFDERVTAQGAHELLHAALSAAPSLGSFAVTETWAGLRPGTPDGLPFLGPTPIEGLVLACGHYRNGILLAPATARTIADVVEGKAALELLAFSLARGGTDWPVVKRTTRV